MDTTFGFSFPAIRGVQGGREYFVSMCPLRLLPRVFAFNEEEVGLAPELKAQRVLNRGRLPEISRYILDNRDNYVFSAITASIDGQVVFEPLTSSGDGKRLGVLRVPMTAQFIINDGQHRRAAIEIALREHPELGDETIAVVFFLDQGLKRCQQMFADLNRTAIRPSRSIGVLYDHREVQAEITRQVVMRSEVFKGLVEMERSTLAVRSRKLFTLSAVYNANNALLRELELSSEKMCDLAIEYWSEVSKYLREWRLVQKGELSSGEVRADYLHSHGVMLQSLGRVGNEVIRKEAKNWTQRLSKLNNIDWSRSNAQWEGRTIIGGRVSKAEANVQLTVNLLKLKLGLPLGPEEQKCESAYENPRRGREQ